MKAAIRWEWRVAGRRAWPPLPRVHQLRIHNLRIRRTVMLHRATYRDARSNQAFRRARPRRSIKPPAKLLFAAMHGE